MSLETLQVPGYGSATKKKKKIAASTLLRQQMTFSFAVHLTLTQRTPLRWTQVDMSLLGYRTITLS